MRFVGEWCTHTSSAFSRRCICQLTNNSTASSWGHTGQACHDSLRGLQTLAMGLWGNPSPLQSQPSRSVVMPCVRQDHRSRTSMRHGYNTMCHHPVLPVHSHAVLLRKSDCDNLQELCLRILSRPDAHTAANLPEGRKMKIEHACMFLRISWVN
jgi:hypothetical protein